MRDAKNIIEGMSKESKSYYLNLMVKAQQITHKEALILTVEERLI